MTTYFKVLKTGRRSNYDSSEWPEPPGIRSVEGDIIPCRNGLHLVDAEHIIDWLYLGTEIWEAEPTPDATTIHKQDKFTVSGARLVRQLPWGDREARLFAADCAAHVLHIYEDRYPGDERPRKAIGAARALVAGDIAAAYAAAAAYDAAAAYADDAAAYAAAAAAAYAAAYADDAAADAADAAAYAAAAAYADDAAGRRTEREWQVQLLLTTLGIKDPE